MNELEKKLGFASPEYEDLCTRYSKVKKQAEKKPGEGPFRQGLWYVRVTDISKSVGCPFSFDYEYNTPWPIKRDLKEELGIPALLKHGREVHKEIAEKAVRDRPGVAVIMEEVLKPERIAVKRKAVERVEKVLKRKEDKDIEEVEEEEEEEITRSKPSTPEEWEVIRQNTLRQIQEIKDAYYKRHAEDIERELSSREKIVVAEVTKAQELIQKAPELEPLELSLLGEYKGLIVSGRMDGSSFEYGDGKGIYDNKRMSPKNLRCRLPSLRAQGKLYCWMLNSINGNLDIPYTLRIYHGNPQTIHYEEIISQDWSQAKVMDILDWINYFFIEKKEATLPRGFNETNCNGCFAKGIFCNALEEREKRWREEARTFPRIPIEQLKVSHKGTFSSRLRQK